MGFFSFLKRRQIKREFDFLRESFNPILSSTFHFFERDDRFSKGISKWDLDNPLLQQWLGYNFGLLEAGASSLFGSRHEYDITRDLALVALIEMQFNGLPGLDIFIHFETARIKQRFEGEDNSGIAASLFDKKPFRTAYDLGVADIGEVIAGRQSLQLGLVMLLSMGTEAVVPKPNETYDHSSVSCCHAEQEFSTEAGALEFSKMMNSTTPDSQVTVTLSEDRNKWLVRWVEPIYLDSDVKQRDVDSLGEEFIF